MKKIVTAAMVLLSSFASTLALAGAECPEHPRSEWIPEETFKKQLIDQGYRIKVFKIDGNCYEVYGWNKAGQKVEVYFDTKTGDVVKSISHSR